jgi:hypothetical protein
MLQLHTNEDELESVKNTQKIEYDAADVAKASASEVFLESPARFITNSLNEQYNSLFNSSKQLSKEEIPDYLHNKFPNGGSQNSVELYDDLYKQHKNNEQVLQNIKNNYSTKSAAIGASLIAGALDPVGIIAGGVAGKLLTEAETVYNLTSMMGRAGISERLTQGVANTAGSVGAFSAPAAVTSYEFRKNVGDDPRPMEILTDIGSGALFGGTIHAGINAFKYFKPFSYDTVSSISNLASKTIQKGKKFSADMLIRAGIRKSVEEAEKAGVYSDIEASTDNLESKINKAKSAFSEIKTDEPSFYKDLKEAVEVTKNIPEKRTEQENAALDSFNAIPQFSELLDAVNTHVNERTVEQSKIINDFIKNEDFETQAIQKNIDDIDKRISKIELSKDENMIEEKNKLIEQRKSIEQIKESKKSYRKITTEQRKALLNLLDAEKIKSHNDLMIRARDEVETISYQDIKAESDKINSIENSPDLYHRESDAALTDYNDSSRVANEKQEQQVDANSKYEMAEEIFNKQIIDESLSPEMVDYLSESVESENAADEEAVNSIDEAIDNTFNCIREK